MTINVPIYVEDIADKIAVYTTIKLYSDTSPTGAFTNHVGDTALVAAQKAYSIADSGTGPWYRLLFYNATGPVQSDISDPWRVNTLDLRTLRATAASRAGAGSSGTCSSAGTSTSLIDAVLRDNGVDEQYLESAWIFRPDAALAADRVRRVKVAGFAPSTGALSFDRAYTNVPADGEVYEVYKFFPPIQQAGVATSWDDIVRDGLNKCWFIDEIDLGVGDGSNRRFSLASFPDVNINTYRRVKLRRIDATTGNIRDISAHNFGRFVSPVTNGMAFALDVVPAPTPQQYVIVEAIRSPQPLYKDADVTVMPSMLAETAVVLAAYERLNQLQPGKYTGEAAAAYEAWAAEQEKQNPPDMILGA